MVSLRDAIVRTSKRIGIDPVDFATAISYETGGTFDPWKKGPTTKWGTHRGLIQWGEPQRKQYGVTSKTSVGDQVEAAGRYLVDRGVRPGMGLMDIYSAINAGGVGLTNRSDAAAGGAPGTVADKVNFQMAGHRRKAQDLIGEVETPNQIAEREASVWGNFDPGPQGRIDQAHNVFGTDPEDARSASALYNAQFPLPVGQDNPFSAPAAPTQAPVQVDPAIFTPSPPTMHAQNDQERTGNNPFQERDRSNRRGAPQFANAANPMQMQPGGNPVQGVQVVPANIFEGPLAALLMSRSA